MIFEGTPVRFDLQWDILDAKEGEVISAENPGVRRDQEPEMLLTFRVIRAYKGDAEQEIQIKTGLGGGDCGAVFSTGLTYLVFANRASTGDLRVSMCSPGGWVGSKSIAAELRYLRKERPIASDLEPYTSTRDTYVAREGQRQRDFEEYKRQYAKVTGKICGTVLAGKTKDGDTGSVSFLSTAGYSPADHPRATINPDGSFCSDPLGPGKYYIFFVQGSGGVATSAEYYPGVSEQANAKTIEIVGGQNESNLIFKIPVQKAYSVRGFVSADDKSGLDSSNADISLIRLGDAPLLVRYYQPIDFQGYLPLPKVKYFNFASVLPGRYIAYVSVLGQGWSTRKEVIEVTSHMKFVSLQLQHKK